MLGTLLQPWQPPQYQEERPQGREQFHGIKLQVPSFASMSDVDACLDWIAKTETVFDYYGYDDERRIVVATVHFTDFAYHWWLQFKASRRREGQPPVHTWQELKFALEERFVPATMPRGPMPSWSNSAKEVVLPMSTIMSYVLSSFAPGFGSPTGMLSPNSFMDLIPS